MYCSSCRIHSFHETHLGILFCTKRTWDLTFEAACCFSMNYYHLRFCLMESSLCANLLMLGARDPALEGVGKQTHAGYVLLSDFFSYMYSVVECFAINWIHFLLSMNQWQSSEFIMTDLSQVQLCVFTLMIDWFLLL